MYAVKRLKCDCCGIYFKRAAYYYIDDQKYFFNKYHKYRWEKNQELRELEVQEAMEDRYNKPGSGNLPS